MCLLLANLMSMLKVVQAMTRRCGAWRTDTTTRRLPIPAGVLCSVVALPDLEVLAAVVVCVREQAAGQPHGDGGATGEVGESVVPGRTVQSEYGIVERRFDCGRKKLNNPG